MTGRSGRNRGDHGGESPRHLRPSERKGAGQRPAGPSRAERRAAARAAREARGEVLRRSGKPAAEPSAEALMRARARMQPPRAPWHPVPLAEMLIAAGLALIVVAAVLASQQGIYAAFVLVLLGTLEFTWREHRHGYRSHGAVIGLCVGFLTGAAVHFLTPASQKVVLGIGVVIALLIWNGLARTFEFATSGDDEPDEPHSGR